MQGFRLRPLPSADAFEIAYRLGDADHRENMTMQLNQALMGCKEGLRLIGKGGKIKLILHPNWADERQDMDDALPNSTLIFEIELIDVVISH